MEKTVLVVGVAVLVLTGSGLVFAGTSATVNPAERTTSATTNSSFSEFGQDSPQQIREINSCTNITESGHYKLTSDLKPALQLTVSSEAACIEIQANDVYFDGNGHTIAGPGIGDGIRIGPDRIDRQTLDNITIQRVTSKSWEVGLGAHWSVDNLTIRDVIFAENGGGVSLIGVDNPVLRNISAVNNGDANGGDGMSFFEVSDIDAKNILVAGNNKHGLALYQDVYDGRFRNVTAVRNGGSSDWTGGFYFSTDARRNFITNALVANNDGAGVRFSDSGDNIVRRARIEGNTGPAIHAEHAGNDLLRNVVVRNNGGFVIRGGEGTVSARSLRIEPQTRIRFSDESVSVSRVDTATLPEPPAGKPVAEGVNLTTIDQRVALTFEQFQSQQEKSGIKLWRYANGRWHPVESARVNPANGEVTATLTNDGIVVPVQAEDTDKPAPSPSIFEILSTDEDGEFGYEFTVDGTAEKAMTDDIAADSGDQILSNSDGTVTVRGSTGSGSGDAFRVIGTISDFRLRYGEPAFVLELDGEDVTDELGGGTVPPEESTVAIYATTEGEDFTYEFTVDGTAEGTMTEDVAADSGDEVIENNDGTVTIRGSTGDLSGDAFLVRGDILTFSTSAAPGEYRVERDSEDVTDELAPETRASTFAIYSTTENVDFGYEFIVDGSVSKTMTETVAADAGENIIPNSDGTVTVRGSTGDLSGDAFTVRGDILSFRILGEKTGYRLERDGVNITDEYGE